MQRDGFSVSGALIVYWCVLLTKVTLLLVARLKRFHGRQPADAAVVLFLPKSKAEIRTTSKPARAAIPYSRRRNHYRKDEQSITS
jgi:hypothetical protein